MTTYSFERIRTSGTGDEFEIDGEIEETYKEKPYLGTFVALVKKPSSEDVDGEVQPATDFSEGVEGPKCIGKDGECSRDVDSPGDTCWQHEDE